MSLFALADVSGFRTDYLAPVLASWAPTANPSDAFLLRELRAAEKDVSHQLRVLLEPTVIFSHTPTTEEIAEFAPNDAPWIEEPGYDYDPEFFQGERWGFITLRQQWVNSVTSIKFAYPSPTISFYQIPNDWIRLDKRAGHIRLVPASAAFNAPLNAFIMQAMSGGAVIPAMIQVQYVAGLVDVANDWPDLLDVIYKKAALKVIEGFYLPMSASISGDGLSQSQSFDGSKYRDLINETMFGPKGSNGGLWVALHGLVTGIMGVTG